MKIRLLLCLFSFSCLSSAQVAVGNKINNIILYRTFTNPMHYNSEELDSFGRLSFLNAGFFVRIPLKEENWVLQTELLYKFECYYFERKSFSDSSAPSYTRFFFEYIDLPVLLQWEAKRAFLGFAQAGLSAKFLTNATNSDGFWFSDERNITRNFNRVVLTAQAGAGVLWDLKRLVLMTDLRLSANLTPVTQHRVRGISLSNGLYSLTHSFGVAYKIPTLKTINSLTDNRYYDGFQ